MIKITLKIEGMSCGMCESHINNTIRKQFEVKKVSSSHSKGITKIIAKEPIDEKALMKAIGETGYTVMSVNTEAYENKGLFRR